MCNSEQLSYHYLRSVLHKLPNNSHVSHVSWVPLNLTGPNFKCKNEKIYIRRFWSRSTKLNLLYFTRLFKCETGMATPLVLHLIEHWLCVCKTIHNNYTLHYKRNLGAASPVEWKYTNLNSPAELLKICHSAHRDSKVYLRFTLMS